MSQVPLFIINLSEDIPLPGGTFHLCVQQDKLHLFSAVELNGSQYVILGVADITDPTDILEDQQGVIDTLLNVGTLCKVQQREESDDFTVITLEVQCRVLIRNLARGRSEDDPFTIWCKQEPVTEEFLTDEEELRADISDMLDIFLRRDRLWRGISNAGHKILRDNEAHLLQKMHIMADHLLEKRDRLDYLQQLSNFDRWNILVHFISKVLAEQKQHQPPALPHKASEKPVKGKSKTKKHTTWREKVHDSDMPEEVREKVLRDVSKLENTPKNSTEFAQASDYLRWIISMPWGKSSYVPTDLQKLIGVLGRTHYGLDEVKEHMLEIMTVQELKGGSDGSVLCFCGPAGTGKTTIAKAIAEVSNRPLIQIALGGMSDTAEFRGHRRTYVASRPGRIVTSIKDKGTMDPLILLDEVDKLAAFKGDPASALLEILDPEQNNKFIDHYLEVPLDLSNAMFICTANYQEQIPAPLLDRFEMIKFRKYTHAERDVITKQFMLPKVLASTNPTGLPVSFQPEALDEIVKIQQVRQIEKILIKLVRKAVTAVHVHGCGQYTVSKADVDKIKDNYKQTTNRAVVGFGARK